MQPATDRRIGRAALIVSATLILMIGVTVIVALWPRDAIELPADWYAGSDYTLVIFGRPGCDACDASAGFHRDIATLGTSKGMRVIAAATSREAAPSDFAASMGLPADHGAMAVPAPAHLTVVPTIVIVDRRGKTLTRKEGALSIDDQRALMEYVRKLK